MAPTVPLSLVSHLNVSMEEETMCNGRPRPRANWEISSALGAKLANVLTLVYLGVTALPPPGQSAPGQTPEDLRGSQPLLFQRGAMARQGQVDIK